MARRLALSWVSASRLYWQGIGDILLLFYWPTFIVKRQDVVMWISRVLKNQPVREERKMKMSLFKAESDSFRREPLTKVTVKGYY